jgi:hypothetical protein
VPHNLHLGKLLKGSVLVRMQTVSRNGWKALLLLFRKPFLAMQE